MGGLCIVQPLPLYQASSQAAARLITPDPKEAITIPNNSDGVSFDFFFGASVVFDSFYIGFHNAPPPAICIMQHPNGIGGENLGNLTGNMSLQPLGLGYPYHSFYRLDAPISTAYIRLTVNAASGGAFQIGTFAVGLAMQPEWGTEYGSGRTIEDTGTSERLSGGGFAIDDGVAASGYQWTFGDLQPDEVRRLYQIVKDRRTTRSLLVVEDPDQTDGLNERIHWGLFRKLDAYERLDPLNTKWSLQIGDWA